MIPSQEDADKIDAMIKRGRTPEQFFNTKVCKSCGLENAKSRFTCTGCGKSFYREAEEKRERATKEEMEEKILQRRKKRMEKLERKEKRLEKKEKRKKEKRLEKKEKREKRNKIKGLELTEWEVQENL